MRVLFQARSNLQSQPGGDTIQLMKTKEHLQALGVETELDPDPSADLTPYDLVHLFNITYTPDTYVQILNARKQKKKTALSTVYWNRDELEENDRSLAVHYREPMRYKLRRFRRSLVAGLGLATREKALDFRKKNLYYRIGYHRQASEILKGADILLPNSEMEKSLILRDFSLPPSKSFHIVVNGIEADFSAAPVPLGQNSFFRKYGVRDFILCVGRIEKRKNQLLLLDALKDLPIAVVLIGSGYDSDYYCKVQSMLRPSDRMIDSWPHDKIQEAYSLARVHVLPSYYETPGLVSLEAGSAGLNVVVGDRGSEVEYFRDYVEYCDPSDGASIRKAVERALERKVPNTDLMMHVRENFTWEKSARQTLEAYRRIHPCPTRTR